MKVLFVDDRFKDPEFVELTTAHAPDIEFEFCSDGDDAYFRVVMLGEFFDLVMSDLDHPGMGGLPLLEAILRARPEQRVAVWTGYQLAEDDPRTVKIKQLKIPYFFKLTRWCFLSSFITDAAKGERNEPPLMLTE